MAKRDIIYDRIMQGGATKEILMEVAEVNDKGLASQMTYLRLMGKCPMKQDDGTYKIVTREEWDAYQESRAGVGGGSRAPQTPAKRKELAEKRVKRAASALDNAQKKFDAASDVLLNDLQFQKAKLELQIAEILEGEAIAAYDAADVKGDEVETSDAVEETEGEDVPQTEDAFV